VADRQARPGGSSARRGGRVNSRRGNSDPWYELDKALDAAFGQDQECTRAIFDIRFVLRTPDEVFARPGLRDKTLQLGSGWRDAQPFGPTREQLRALVSAS
jgi:hypothetical protein